MKTIVLRYEETIECQVVVNVPDDFDPDVVDPSELEEAVCDLEQDSYYACADRGGYWIESTRKKLDPSAEDLFAD